jgi:transcriptional regulator with XRE-family HTH domain
MFFILHHDSGSGEVGARLAANLRRLRIASRHSLSALARATQISKATLSGIEAGTGNPTVQTLAALASALHVSVAELLQEAPAGEVRILRSPRTQRTANEGLVLRGLESFAAAGNLDISELIIPAGTVHQSSPGAPGSRVNLLVLQGKLIAGPSERISELSSGDYCSFPADGPHLYEARGALARALLITASM